MPRKLFCEISPLTYRISTQKEILLRRLSDLGSGARFAQTRDPAPLPVLVYRHNSLIRRTLGGVDRTLQENKAVNLSLAAPKVNGILIRPGETFSFWRLVGDCTAKKGYRMGLTIERGVPSRGIGGGMCQFTNLIHWMALHSPLTVAEHHHHDGVDLFPDCNRQVPFGVGTSILYNYLDYRLKNETGQTFQLLVHTGQEYLHGELRCEQPLPEKRHVEVEQEWFERGADGNVYRSNVVARRTVRKSDGVLLNREVIKRSRARVLYDPALTDPAKWREPQPEEAKEASRT